MKAKITKLMMETSHDMMSLSIKMKAIFGKRNGNANELRGAALMLADWAYEIDRESDTASTSRVK